MSEAHPATPEQPASGGEQSAAAASPAVPNTPSPPATPAASGDQPTAPTAPAASASASSETFARLVERLGRSGGQHVHATLLPERPGTSGEWPQWVHPRIVDAWRARGAELPWLHQRRALDAIREGNDCVIATGTGSGKSLLAWTPILSDLASAEQSTRISEVHRTPTCLYIAPTKALAADQLNALNTLLAAIPDVEGIHVGAADGDTPREAKDWARAYASIIVTNPDYVHHVLLPGHERWTRFLSSLRYIVIDELHQWRGVSGSHIALVIRRLLRIAHLLGASPQVIMMSATVRDPHRVGTQMVGRDRLVAISEDTSPSGAHHIVLWQGREIPRDEDIPIDAFLRALAQAEAGEEAVLEAPMTRISAQTEAAQLTAALVESGARLLTFVRSRGGAETVAAQVRERLVASPEHARAVAVGVSFPRSDARWSRRYVRAHYERWPRPRRWSWGSIFRAWMRRSRPGGRGRRHLSGSRRVAQVALGTPESRCSLRRTTPWIPIWCTTRRSYSARWRPRSLTRQIRGFWRRICVLRQRSIL